MSGSARTGSYLIASVMFVGTTLASVDAMAQAAEVDTNLVQPGQEVPHLIELHGGLAHSDNVRRVSSDAESDTLASVGLGIDYGYTGAQLTASAHGVLDYVEYLQNTYGGTLAGTIDSEAVLASPSRMFQWMVGDTFGQTRNNALAAATPDNLQNVNVITTGPTLNFHLGQSVLTLDGRYADQSYESSDFDSKRWVGRAGLGRDLSATSNVSLNAEIDRVRFDNTIVNTDYDTRQYYGRYRSRLGRSTISADLGYTQVKLDDRNDSQDSPLVRLDVERRITGSSTLFLGGTTQYMASVDALRAKASSDTPSAGSADPLSASDPYREREVHAGWQFSRPRTSLTVTGSYATQRYQQSTEFDRDVWGAVVQATRHIAPTLWLTAGVTWQKEDYDNIAASTRDTSVTTELKKDLGRKLSTSLRYDYTKRSASGAATGYKENIIGLYFSYAALGR